MPSVTTLLAPTDVCRPRHREGVLGAELALVLVLKKVLPGGADFASGRARLRVASVTTLLAHFICPDAEGVLRALLDAVVTGRRFVPGGGSLAERRAFFVRVLSRFRAGRARRAAKLAVFSRGALLTGFSGFDCSWGARPAFAPSLLTLRTRGTDDACIESTDTVSINSAFLAGVGSLVSVEAWAAVLAPGSSGIASEADTTKGFTAVVAAGAARVGVLAINTNLAAVAAVDQFLATRALVAGGGAFDEVEGPRVAIFARSGLGRTGVFSNGAQGAGLRAVGVVGVGASWDRS